MSHDPAYAPLPPAQRVAQRIFTALERFLHIEAVSGVVLLIAAAAAMLWANSAASDSYHAFWEAPLSIGLGAFVIQGTTHYVVNEVLMTIFFLVVGMEIRREMHEGALSSPRAAALPLAAALGGVVVPAVIYLTLNHDPELHAGWAVPTATDIAFAVGVLALLGRSIPGTVRILLLALAIVDDIAAVVIIALFYSGGIHFAGLLYAAAGVLLVLGLHRIGVGATYAYVVPGALVWFGLHEAGVHPTLAGVALGLLTPARPMRPLEKSIEITIRALKDLGRHSLPTPSGLRGSEEAFKRLTETQRELLPPLIRVQAALHPWVAFGVMPLFALANAGVDVRGIDLAHPDARNLIVGVFLALLVGKPVGIFSASWLAVRLGWCTLPAQATWRGVVLVGLLGGIGFTMSIFIAGLGFSDPELLSAAKMGVLLGSGAAALVGLTFGFLFVRRARPAPEPASAVEAETPAPKPLDP